MICDGTSIVFCVVLVSFASESYFIFGAPRRSNVRRTNITAHRHTQTTVVCIVKPIRRYTIVARLDMPKGSEADACCVLLRSIIGTVMLE